MSKFLTENKTDIPVIDETEVLVVGGGPAGIGASIAAARAGVKVILMERYGHLGGMSTGGEVILIPPLSYKDTIMIRGIILEMVERLEKIPNGIFGPPRDIVGSQDKNLVAKWDHYFNMVWNGYICYGGYTDPELLKIVLLQMAEEAGVKLYLHSWGCKAVTVDDAEVTGVFFESKQGRNAILAKAIVDCTGDGDICASAGAQYDIDPLSTMRTSAVSTVIRLGGADFEKFALYKANYPDKWLEHFNELKKITGCSVLILPTARNDVVWVNNFILGYSCINVQDLTQAELFGRRTILDVIDYINSQQIPGLSSIWLYDTCSQIGTRGSRRIRGEYTLTMDDMVKTRSFEDVIAVFPAVDVVKTTADAEDSSKQGPVQIPLRTLICYGKKNLLMAGRCFSSDAKANNANNLIPHSVAMGQAAGVAAAVAVSDNTPVPNVNINKVQKELRRQNVYLPGVIKNN